MAVNGEVWPRLGERQVIRAGEVQRWRLIHSGVRNGINLKLIQVDPADAQRKLAETFGRLGLSPEAQSLVGEAVNGRRRNGNSAELLRRIPEAGVIPGTDERRSAREDLIGSIYGDKLLRHVAVASDGLTRERMTEEAMSHLQSGYRADILVAFPAAGLYCVLDGAAAPDARPAGGDDRIRRYISSEIMAANQGLPAAVRQRLAAGDLSDYVFSVDVAGNAQHPVPDGGARTLSYRVGPQDVSQPGSPLRFG